MSESVIEGVSGSQNEQTPTRPNAKRRPSWYEVHEIIIWLKSQIASVDTKAFGTKADKVREAAQILLEKGMKESRIAQELAHHAKEIGITKQWVYEVLPDNYKNPKMIEAIKAGIAAKSQSQLVDSIKRKSTRHSIAYWIINEDGSRNYQPFLIHMFRTAKNGDCKNCTCVNCERLRTLGLE